MVIGKGQNLDKILEYLVVKTPKCDTESSDISDKIYGKCLPFFNS